ncbi:hypothetical protein FC89_GL002099 [Liquorilactobacillus ghanensis DSM 18630]|uniref:Uncharacterized protein n=1 Tax=Liquorilactobacillus ghanensis DSM 18630 TaxID=1423750 RepID=A0A0R1VYR3_9LACO|nr:hypothetical protein FC89_GL002099 [Liquorilactobacillus ghanensis DSM 18630]
MQRFSGFWLTLSSLIWIGLLSAFHTDFIKPITDISTISSIILLTLTQIITGLFLLTSHQFNSYFFRSLCLFLLCISLISIPFGILNASPALLVYAASGLLISFFQLLKLRI